MDPIILTLLTSLCGGLAADESCIVSECSVTKVTPAGELKIDRCSLEIQRADEVVINLSVSTGEGVTWVRLSN